MITHIPASVLPRKWTRQASLAKLYDREPQLVCHPAVAELLGLPDACLVLAPENVGAEHYEPLKDRFADVIDGLDRLRLLSTEHGPLGV